MARIRTIKPDFWTDEKVVALSPLARLLFIGTWNFVDDYGRAEYSPTRLKMQVLPADSADIRPLLAEIIEAGLITIYNIDGKDYFEVRGFSKHQKVDRRGQEKIPPPRRIPPNPPEGSRVIPPPFPPESRRVLATEKEKDQLPIQEGEASTRGLRTITGGATK